jgi:hypothetical protein
MTERFLIWKGFLGRLGMTEIFDLWIPEISSGQAVGG